MRFQVSRVMDAIEQRLTTDLTGAQAVVDLGKIVNHVALDRGRSVNLVRIGMVLDALSRYLVDGGAMLYGVADRKLLAEPALTSKERMVLGRWADDGRIEVTPTVGDAVAGAAERSAGASAGQQRFRPAPAPGSGAGAKATDVAHRVVEIADLTGLPLIALHPYAGLTDRYGWLRDSTGRVLMLTYRSGFASLRPFDGAAEDAATSSTTDAALAAPAVGRAPVPVQAKAGQAAGSAADPGERPAAGTGAAGPGPGSAESVRAAGERLGGADQAAGEVARPPAAANAARDAAKVEAAGKETGGKNGAVTVAEPGESATTMEAESVSGAVASASGAGASSGGAEAAEAGGESAPAGTTGGEQDAAPAAEPGDRAMDEPGDRAMDEGREVDQSGEARNIDKSDPEDGAGEPEPDLPLPLAFFADRGARVSRTRVSRHRFRRGEQSSRHATVLRREWRCDSFDCPAFGEHRQIGQPVPRMRGEVPVCPRHDQPVADVGPRPPAYAVSVVVDDLPRQRLVVRGGRPVEVGRATDDSAGNEFAAGPSEPDLVSVAPWLHQSAAAWISPVHLRLEASEDGLVVTDLSDNGTVVWQRKGPDDPGATRLLRRETLTLGEWDGVELYTGIELVRADRRLTAVLGRDEPTSVLLDAPTAAHHQVATG